MDKNRIFVGFHSSVWIGQELLEVLLLHRLHRNFFHDITFISLRHDHQSKLHSFAFFLLSRHCAASVGRKPSAVGLQKMHKIQSFFFFIFIHSDRSMQRRRVMQYAIGQHRRDVINQQNRKQNKGENMSLNAKCTLGILLVDLNL